MLMPWNFLLHGIDVNLDNLPEQHPYDFVYDGDFLNFELTKNMI